MSKATYRGSVNGGGVKYDELSGAFQSEPSGACQRPRRPKAIHFLISILNPLSHLSSVKSLLSSDQDERV